MAHRNLPSPRPSWFIGVAARAAAPAAVALALLLPAAAVLAQAAPAAEAGEPVRPELQQHTGLFAVDLFWTSPVIISIILVLSVLAAAMFLYFMATITVSSMAPSDVVNNVTRLVIDRQYKEAADYCRGHRGIFVASVVQRCLENAGKEHSVILDMIDAEGQRRADVVWNRISYLGDIANVSPMLGLLGTVWGMILAFFALPEHSMSAMSRHLSQAVGGAMATTLFGLIVAIFALVCYSIVKSRATKVLATVEDAVHTIADHIKRDTGRDEPRRRPAMLRREDAANVTGGDL